MTIGYEFCYYVGHIEYEEHILKLYNSMTRRKEVFKPRNSSEVKIFTCGPSTYRRPHIGNYRTFLYEDILVRYLTYLGYRVQRVINFTDVEDKTIVEAENKGRSIEEITSEVHEHFFRETELLGILLPEDIPRSSTSVDQAVEIIQELLRKGVAYRHKGDVFFDPLKYKGFGRLFGLDMSTWPEKKVRFKKDTYNGKRWNRGDFILWHGQENQSPDSAYWDSEIGPGRPSWNIQDPAMILQQIGTQIDIKCGGIDNIYRHHDYNIAVMESFSGKSFAKYFLHGEHLIVDGTAMSKSRGNILYPDDLIDQGYEPKHLRFFLTYTYYRKKLNFTEKSFGKTSEILDGFRSRLNGILDSASPSGNRGPEVKTLIDTVAKVFQDCMNDDLHLGDAFDGLKGLLDDIANHLGDEPIHESLGKRLSGEMEKVDQVFGVIFP